MIRVLPLLVIFILFILAPWYFFKNPLDAAYCLMAGNEWENQGENSRYCKETFSDAGRLCAKNSQCKSGKCVIGMRGQIGGVSESTLKPVSREEMSLGVFNNILDDTIRGKCSPTSQDPCYSGEMTVDESRIIHTPSVCE